MKILLAGPGTGKTTKVKSIIDTDYSSSKSILVLSFTNATVNDLKSSFIDYKNVKCYNLHSYALMINHLPDLHVLDTSAEIPIIQKYSKKLNIPFDDICLFLNCITFESMIDKCISFMRSNPAYVLEKIGKLDLLVVDEFQDFNPLERELVFLISEYSQDTIILGDDDQSIYGFKDADPDGIITLYNDTSTEKLDHENICYRCPNSIVEYCNKLIQKNKNRIEKDWKTSNRDGEIKFLQTLTQDDTFTYITGTIKSIYEKSEESSILILSPVRYYLEDLKNKLQGENIDFVDFWGTNIDSKTQIIIWWFKAVYSNGNLLNLLFICYELGYLTRDIFVKLLSESFEKGINKTTLIKSIVGLKNFPEPFSEYLITPPELSEFFSKHEEFEILQEYIDEDEIDKSIRDLIKNLNPTTEFKKGSVNIMSIHKSKGLQAEEVFITGLVDGILPNDTKGTNAIEVQRRLLFVGMTRALKNLHIISTIEWDGKYVNRVDKSKFQYKYQRKKYFGKTSRFVEDMIK